MRMPASLMAASTFAGSHWSGLSRASSKKSKPMSFTFLMRWREGSLRGDAQTQELTPMPMAMCYPPRKKDGRPGGIVFGGTAARKAGEGIGTVDLFSLVNRLGGALEEVVASDQAVLAGADLRGGIAVDDAAFVPDLDDVDVGGDGDSGDEVVAGGEGAGDGDEGGALDGNDRPVERCIAFDDPESVGLAVLVAAPEEQSDDGDEESDGDDQAGADKQPSLGVSRIWRRIGRCWIVGSH